MLQIYVYMISILYYIILNFCFACSDSSQHFLNFFLSNLFNYLQHKTIKVFIACISHAFPAYLYKVYFLQCVTFRDRQISQIGLIGITGRDYPRFYWSV